MKIGIIDILVSHAPSKQLTFKIYHYLVSRQFASIMAQSVSVWCRQLGHEVHYNTYWGQDRLELLVPDDLDVLFVASFTQSSPLAYALAKIFRGRGTLCVLGGPHGKAFPSDSLRFFDIVVQHCDRSLISEILNGNVDRNSTVSVEGPPAHLPSVEERLPEIKIANYRKGRPYISSTIPLISSTGCPYTCNFCIDASVSYRPMLEDLEVDLTYIRDHMPGVRIGFQDPNFAVKFDQTLDILERVGTKNTYIAESSLSILRSKRLARMRDTGCIFIAPGIESWSDYSNKSGIIGSSSSPTAKLDQVVEHIHEIGEYIPGIQSNFILGLDIDHGDEPFRLTNEFILRCPQSWTSIMIPIPYGGTDIHKEYLDGDRILRKMPWSFYYIPYLVTTLSNYKPIDFYGKLAELYFTMGSSKLLAKRFATSLPWSLKSLFVMRAHGANINARRFLRIQKFLEDEEVRRFHDGEAVDLPRVYEHEYEKRVGPYAELFTKEERLPVFS